MPATACRSQLKARPFLAQSKVSQVRQSSALRGQRRYRPERQKNTSISVQAPVICRPVSPMARKRCSLSMRSKKPCPATSPWSLPVYGSA
ncbi:hypothetical protein D3C71_1355760 [compost metagenome]